jgi:hypothetical protein
MEPNVKQYRVVLRTKSRVTLGRGEAIDFAEPKASIRARVRTLYRTDERGTSFPGELEVTAVVSAADANAASATAFEQAHFLAAIFGLIGAAPVHLPRFHLVHEIGPDESEREFQQFIEDDLGLRPTRRIPKGAPVEVFQKLFELQPDSYKRLSRALRWYRGALTTDDVLDRFTQMWAAFETLNPVLGKHLGVPMFEEAKCPKCGEAIKRPVAGGAYGWIEHELGREVAGKTRRLRNGLLHGYEDLDKLAAIAREILPGLERALSTAIGELLGLGDEVKRLIGAYAPAAEKPYSAVLVGVVSGPVEKMFSETGDLPHFEGRTVIIDSRNTGPEEQERIKATLSFEGPTKAPAGTSIRLTGVGLPTEPEMTLEGPPEVTITKAQGNQNPN